MIGFINLPLWVLFLVAVGGPVVLAVLSRRVARRVFGGWGAGKVHETANAMRDPIGTIVALILALASVQVVADYQQAEGGVSKEADVLWDLYRDALSYDAAGTAGLRHDMRVYVNDLITKEWPALRLGKGSPVATRSLDKLFADLSALKDAGGGDGLWFNQMVGKVNRLAELRRDRIEASHSALPPVFWLVMLSGTGVMIALSWVLPPGRGCDSVVAGFAAVYGLVFLLNLTLDLPFSGDLAVRPTVLVHLVTVISP